MQEKIILIISTVVILGLLGFALFSIKKTAPDTNDQTTGAVKVPIAEKQEAPITSEEPKMQELSYKQFDNAPEISLEEGKNYQAVIKTNKGDIKIDLFEDKTPITVNNFVFLSKEGFYDNTKFHRIIKGFMIQGGDPTATGTGGPGYSFDDEPFEGDYSAGTIAMANAGPNTNGSQFFIMHKNYQLPKNYVIFGKATDQESIGVIDQIANTPVAQSQSGENSRPTQDIIINSVEVTAL